MPPWTIGEGSAVSVAACAPPTTTVQNRAADVRPTAEEKEKNEEGNERDMV